MELLPGAGAMSEGLRGLFFRGQTKLEPFCDKLVCCLVSMNFLIQAEAAAPVRALVP